MYNILSVLMDALFLSLLILCAYSDSRKRTVSNAAIVHLLGLGLVHTLLIGMSGSGWWFCPAGLVLAVPFFIVWLRGGMGAGDVKLIMGICLYLGVLNTLIAFTFIIPALICLMVLSWIKAKTFNRTIPFAPVLALGSGSAVVIGYLYALLQIIKEGAK